MSDGIPIAFICGEKIRVPGIQNSPLKLIVDSEDTMGRLTDD